MCLTHREMNDCRFARIFRTLRVDARNEVQVVHLPVTLTAISIFITKDVLQSSFKNQVQSLIKRKLTLIYFSFLFCSLSSCNIIISDFQSCTYVILFLHVILLEAAANLRANCQRFTRGVRNKRQNGKTVRRCLREVISR